MCSVCSDYSGSRWPLRHSRSRPRRSSVCGRLLALGLLIACVRRATADERPAAANPQAAREVAHLIGQLDADSRAERGKARDALLARGPAILPLLPDDRQVPSAAARQALAEIRARLQHEAALVSLRPSRVTLKGTFALRDVLAKISSQTGNEFDTSGLDADLLSRPIAVDFESRTFWSACDQLGATARFSFGSVRKGRLQLVRVPRNSVALPLAVADDGPFRVAVLSAKIRPSAISRTLFALRVGWSLQAEPRLRPLFASIAGRDLSADADEPGVPPVDASGAARPSLSLRPISPAAKLELSMEEGQEPLELDSDFECPGTPKRLNITLNGSFAVEMAAAPERFVFANLATPNPPAKRIGGVSVRLRHIEPPAGGNETAARVDLSVVYDQQGPAFESFRTWMYHNDVWLETKNGRRILPERLVATQTEADGARTVEYNFAGVTGTLADYRLVYIAPTLITQAPVRFQLKSIPTTRAGQQGTSP
jgi:hypothetical protein